MKVIYPGSFDPITLGHLDIIGRATKKFDKVYVAILNNIRKNYLFDEEERKKIIEDACKNFRNVEVVIFDGLLVDLCDKLQVYNILRGLRMISDYEAEVQMALTNKSMNEEIETYFMVSSPSYSHVSSTLVKEIVHYNGDFKKLVPDLAYKMLKEIEI
ncbi:pantetheine-phosphate adenylyltransferase [Lagierella sp.]|uniref:pantetheine-phosphate adenylyltransferase n=1 Tax=Lagierella sp. TaxID=2849657 RepID=UPI00261488A9|nr:pantetheine-phosphate adenylyltransferase [Lagierella sp.]